MKTYSKIILGVLIIFGIFLRVYNLTFQCLWTEEQYTLDMAKMPALKILTTFDFNPPIYYLFAHFSYILSGGYDIAIRYPSVICGILIIPAMYWLGVTYKDELTGLYCAAFATIIFPLTYYAQYARAYEMSVLCFVIALVFYIKTKRGESGELWFWIMALVNIYVHLFAIIPIGLLCADLLLERWQRWLCALLTAILSLPLFSVLTSVWSNRNVSAGVSYGANAIQMIVLTPIEFFNIIFLNIFVLAGIGVWMDKDPLRNRLFIVTALTLIIGVICSMFTPFFPRYYMTVSMIIVLFASVASVDLSRMIKFKYMEIVIFILVIFIFSWMTLPNFESHYWIQQYVCN